MAKATSGHRREPSKAARMVRASLGVSTSRLNAGAGDLGGLAMLATFRVRPQSTWACRIALDSVARTRTTVASDRPASATAASILRTCAGVRSVTLTRPRWGTIQTWTWPE